MQEIIELIKPYIGELATLTFCAIVRAIEKRRIEKKYNKQK